jgi:DNA-directed RNA polymerase specialized sigma24 family protein
MSNDSPEDSRGLPLTDWSLVAHAGQSGEQKGLDSLNELLSRYRPALKAHLVLKQKIPPAQADDLIQGFISAKILEGSLVSRANPEKGKFRTILLTALDHYVISMIRRESAKKRSPEEGLISLDDSPDQLGAVPPPPDPFDVAWAHEIIVEALGRVKAECTTSGRSAYWSVFDCRLVAPILDGVEPLPYEQMVEKFGFRSPTEASNALVTAKRMFVRALRAVVAEYASDNDGIDKEIEELRAILSRVGA